MTTSTRFGCMKCKECGELLCERRFLLELKSAVCKRCLHRLFTNAVYGQQFCIEVKHSVRKKAILEFYKRKGDLW